MQYRKVAATVRIASASNVEGNESMSTTKTGLRIAVFAALVAAMLAFTAATAFAGPSEDTLNVTQLQSAIDANGGVLHGYLKTVVKGSKVVTLSVDVLAVTTGFGSGPADLSSLILFESHDDTMTKIGGIAAGMSGSPIYVDDGTGDKLIGALSYGDIFTTNGTGLATPIGAMAAAQDAYAPSPMPRRLSSPVVIDGQVKDRVLVVNDPGEVVSAPANTIVAAPKNAVFIGGINPKSNLFVSYAKYLKTKGIDVIPTEGGLSAKESTYSAPFEGGSAVAVLAACGDLWAGGIGTVTYVDTPTVVAFGHSAYWTGDSGLFLMNAWIDGIWPSTYEAYKLGRPAAVRGTLTQDRMAAVIGVDGQMPDVTSIAATATNTETGEVATSAVELTRFVANSPNPAFFGLAASSAYVAGSRVFDAQSTPGSAVTTTTVTVSDGSHTYELVRRNVFSDGNDIPSAVVSDVNDMVSDFEDANGNGIAHADILSVGFETEFSSARREAQIVGVDAPNGLKTGDNVINVLFLQFGEPATQTVPVHLHIPSGVPVAGTLSAVSVNYPRIGMSSSSASDPFAGLDGLFSGPYSTIDRRTAKDVVDELNATVDNSVISVSFLPGDLTNGGNSGTDSGAPVAAAKYAAVEVTQATPWVSSGSVSKVAPMFLFDPDNETSVPYGWSTEILGSLIGVDGDGSVRITAAGVPTSTVPVTEGEFAWLSPSMKKNTTFTFTFLGNDEAAPAVAKLRIYVAARTTLTASKGSAAKGSSVTLTAKILPATAGGSVAFQRWDGWMWSTLKTAPVPSSGIVTYKYSQKSKGSATIRARFLGSASNTSSNSSSVTIKFK